MRMQDQVESSPPAASHPIPSSFIPCYTLAARTSSGSTAITSNRPWPLGAFHRSPNSPWRDEAAGQAQQRLGQDQPDHPFLVPLQQLHHGRADPLVGRG